MNTAADIYSPGWHYAIPASEDLAAADSRARACYRKRFNCEPPGDPFVCDAVMKMRVLVYPLPVAAHQSAFEGVL